MLLQPCISLPMLAQSRVAMEMQAHVQPFLEGNSHPRLYRTNLSPLGEPFGTPGSRVFVWDTCLSVGPLLAAEHQAQTSSQHLLTSTCVSAQSIPSD